jgi:hypothetical protein
MLSDILEGEHDRILGETSVEAEWWPKPTKFPLETDSERALKDGVLTKIPREGSGWRTIGRLNDIDEPTWLRPETLSFINDIFPSWKGNYNIPPNTFLAITSVGRNKKHQEFLCQEEGGYRAAPSDTSSHLSGAAFDVSLRSYYVKDPSGKSISVAVWNTNDRYPFEPQITDSFLSTALLYEEEGRCNVVVEKAKQGEAFVDSVIHICICSEGSESL